MTRISTLDLLTPRKSKEARCGGSARVRTFEGEDKASVPVMTALTAVGASSLGPVQQD
jgi:hypothetical protein